MNCHTFIILRGALRMLSSQWSNNSCLQWRLVRPSRFDLCVDRHSFLPKGTCCIIFYSLAPQTTVTGTCSLYNCRKKRAVSYRWACLSVLAYRIPGGPLCSYSIFCVFFSRSRAASFPREMRCCKLDYDTVEITF